MRQITIDLSIILELVNCAKVYGFANSILLSDFAKISGKVTDEEIVQFAQENYLSNDAAASGYKQEDYDYCIQTLTEWRDKYH